MPDVQKHTEEMESQEIRLSKEDMDFVEQGYATSLSFNQAFKETREKHMSQRRLSDRSGISVETIRRMENNKDYRANLNSIVAICIALHLPYRDSTRLVRLAGYILCEWRKTDRIYMVLLEKYNMYEVPACNEILRNMGMEELTSKDAFFNFSE